VEVKGSNGCGVLEGKGPSTIKYEADGTQPPLTTAVLEAAAAGGCAPAGRGRRDAGVAVICAFFYRRKTQARQTQWMKTDKHSG